MRMMTDHTPGIFAELACHRCGYDLRAHPKEGKCSECGASVAESTRLAAIPRHAAWRDRDPRWRRRILAGAWILLLMPLMDALETFGRDWSVHVPNVFGFRGSLRLDETLLSSFGVYAPLVFCIGVVLLFSKERGRRPAASIGRVAGASYAVTWCGCSAPRKSSASARWYW